MDNNVQDRIVLTVTEAINQARSAGRRAASDIRCHDVVEAAAVWTGQVIQIHRGDKTDEEFSDDINRASMEFRIGYEDAIQRLHDLHHIADEIAIAVNILSVLHKATAAQMNVDELSAVDFGVLMLAMIERAGFRLEDAFDLASGGQRLNNFNVRALFDHETGSEEVSDA